jgi:glycosyltransferase involved in cell wall biosynthesis
LKKILFIVSEDWYFVSHRLHIAIAAMENGYEVALLSRLSTYKEFLESQGIKVIDWPLDRSSRNPLKELLSIYQVIYSIRTYKPNLIHSVAIKPVIYSLLSKVFYRADGLILALAGLGFVFRSKSSLSKILRFFLIPIFKLLLIGENIRLVIQNNDDINLLLNLKIIDLNKIRLIRGSGVNTSIFFPNHDHHETSLVILPARMLWNKGVQDFVNCAKKFINKDKNVRFALVGEPDFHNPESISIMQLKKWVELGFVEWWEKKNNMLEVFHMADIVCFPSYHEGLPKALLEAASCEIPIVAYDVSGCREIVKDNINGFLIPFKDEDALCKSIIKLLENSKLRLEMGKKGREIVINDFTENRISSETMKVWAEVLR